MAATALQPEPVHLPVLAMPATRAGCAEVVRPCAFERCKHHLGAERRGRAVPPGAPTCALDVADEGGATLDRVAVAFGVTRERIRQLEAAAIRRLAGKMKRRGLLSDAEAVAAPANVRAVLRRGLVA